MTKPDSRKPFRSVDEWKSALMTLPDSSFFELLRSVFGNIKTPFNKQRLLEDLFILFSRDEIRRTIAAYINDQDHKLIAAVALLDEPAPEDLENFFDGEFSYAELHALIINLEERLIIYRVRNGELRDKDVLRLALNPVLASVLAPFVADAHLLFPSFALESSFPLESSVPTSDNEDGIPSPVRIPEGRTLAAFFVFIAAGEELFKGEGGLRRKILDDGKKFFPGLNLELTVGILLRLGLFRRENESGGGKLIACGERITEYSELSAAEREDYWIAGLYLYLNEAEDEDSGEFSFRFSRSSLRGIAAFIHRYRLLLEYGKQYPVITLRRLWKLLEREYERVGSFRMESGPRFPFDPFLEVMEMSGLLEKQSSRLKLRDNSGRRKEAQAEQPVIVMDTAFSFILYPEISFADAMAMGAFCSLRDPAASVLPGGAVVCFELTSESAVRGFDQGIDSAAMLKLLKRLSHNRIDASLEWTLKDWESRYNEVSLHQGIVLSLAEGLRYLASAEPVASLVQRTLAPGVYLLSAGEKTRAVRALRKAGVEIIAQPPSAASSGAGIETGRSGFYRNSFPRLETPESDKTLAAFSAYESGSEESPEKPLQSGTKKAGSADSIRQSFHRVLETMQITRGERDELAARIERNLVLSKAQLEGTSLRYEKLEARGLDYTGKTLIAKQAIAAGSLLEVSWPGPGGEINRTVGIPSALEKKEGNSVLVLKSFRPKGKEAETQSDSSSGDTMRIPGDTIRIPGDTIRIPLGKISLLRRIKQSIFNQ